jgi:hypothetical protein
MSLKLNLFAVLLLIGYEPPTQAHDIYSQLKDRWGNSCCNNRDCRPAPYRVTANGLQMYVNGNWIVVPGAAIQYRALPGDSGETHGGHWCGHVLDSHDNRWLYITQCAILPPDAAATLGSPFAFREGHTQPVP